MLVRDFHAQDLERRHLLQAQLPQRLTRLRQRGERLCQGHWDINELSLLAEDALRLAEACRGSDVSALATCLDSLHETAASLLRPPRLPNQATAARIAKLVETLVLHRLPDAADTAQGTSEIAVGGPTHASGFPLLVVPPDRYWTRLAALTVTGAPCPPSDTPASVTRTRGELMRRLSECLAMEDANVRGGGLLLFAPEGAESRRLQLGNARCDALLTAIGDFLVAHAGRNDVMARGDGDSFLLFNPDCDPGLLEAYAQKLCDRIAQESFDPESGHHFLFDVGVCPFVAGATQADAMYDAASGAIDSARQAGRHGVSIVRQIEPPIDTALVERIRIALNGSGFQLLFQPIVSLRGQEEEQFQVLLRLQGDDQRVHTAAEVIPAAKRSGLIGAVDRWVLERCAHLIGNRSRCGRSPRLFVTQSLDSMRDPASPGWLRALLERHQISGDTVSVELHARDATSALADVKRYVIAMKEVGASLTLSGFEAGEAGERLMQALPADYIKLAPRYLRFGDAAISSELRALVGRTQERGKRVIAPRVEDARGAAALWAAGIDFIQGNFVQQAGADLAFDFQAAVI